MLDRGRKPVVIAVFARTRYFAKVRVDGSNPFARSIILNENILLEDMAGTAAKLGGDRRRAVTAIQGLLTPIRCRMANNRRQPACLR
jgi:hypothetical protein